MTMKPTILKMRSTIAIANAANVGSAAKSKTIAGMIPPA